MSGSSTSSLVDGSSGGGVCGVAVGVGGLPPGVAVGVGGLPPGVAVGGGPGLPCENMETRETEV